MGTAMATYAGQNYGARRMERIKSGIRAGLTIQAIYSAAAWAVLLVLKKPLVYLLLGEVSSPEAAASTEYLTIITTLFGFHGSLMIFRNTVQGMGFGASALGPVQQLLPDLCVLPHGLGTGLRLLCWPVRLLYSEKNQRICC